MKSQIIILALLLCFGCLSVSNAQSKYGSPVADSIMSLVNYSSKHNFFDLYENILSDDGTFPDHVNLKPLIGSYETRLFNGLRLNFDYYFKVYNNGVYTKSALSPDEIKDEVDNLFKLLMKDPAYTLSKSKYLERGGPNKIQIANLSKNGYQIISYADKKGKGIYDGTGDFILTILEQPKDSVYADEKRYNGVFPDKVNEFNTPQIVEIKSADGKRVERFNGIFGTNGTIREGKVMLHGYGPFYDGTWWSDDWNARFVYVEFVPENSNNLVFGNFSEKFMLNFHLNTESRSKYHPQRTGTNNCKWVTEVYNPYDQKRDQVWYDKLAEQYRLHPEYKQQDRDRLQKESAARDNAGRIPFFCSCCNGVGTKTTTSKGKSYLNTNSSGYKTIDDFKVESCPCCHGKR